MFNGQFSGEGTLLVTSCTARKKARSLAVEVPSRARFTSVRALAAGWSSMTREAGERVEARDLYKGRAFRDARLAAELARADLYVVSAGFGLVEASERLPNYNLTVAEGAGSIRGHLEACGATPCSWWRELNAERGSPSPLAALAMRPDGRKVLVALPSSYLRMVAEDLASMPPSSVEQLWILTSRAGVSCLPRHLQARVLPYDERLEHVEGHAGTASDFPQRALRHLVEVLRGHQLSFEDAKVVVQAALGKPAKIEAPSRARATDEQIQELLRAQWTAQKGRSTKLLRFLRDDAQVACEQGRFRDIWRSVKAQEQA